MTKAERREREKNRSQSAVGAFAERVWYLDTPSKRMPSTFRWHFELSIKPGQAQSEKLEDLLPHRTLRD